MPKESGGGKEIKKKGESLEELEIKLKQVEAAIEEREKETPSPDDIERYGEKTILNGFRQNRDDLLKRINKLKSKNKPV